MAHRKIPLLPQSNRKITARDYNRLAKVINSMGTVRATGRGVRCSHGPDGTSISILSKSPASAALYIAEVHTDVAGKGGFYNCYLQTFDADDWKQTTDGCDDTGDTVEVLNLPEVGSAIHYLDANDKIVCWNFTDDEGNARYIGIAALRYTSC